MSVFKRWNGTQWETIGPGISSARFDNINNMIAPEFDPKNIYDVGDYVVQSDKLYRCINRIGTPQAWNSGKWREVKLGQDVTELRNDVVVVSDTQPTSENNRIWVKPNNNDMKIPLVEDVMMLPNPNDYGENDQIPRSTGTGIEWVDYGLPSDQQTEDAINAWLNAHPEATTTVQDNSLTYKKLVNGTLNFVTPEMYGAVGDGIVDDTEALKQAIQSGYNVYCNNIYKITETILILNSCIIFGKGTIFMNSSSTTNSIFYCQNDQIDLEINGLTFRSIRNNTPIVPAGHSRPWTSYNSNIIAIFITPCNTLKVYNCFFDQIEYCIKTSRPSTESGNPNYKAAKNIIVEHCKCIDQSMTFYFSNVDQIYVNDCYIQLYEKIGDGEHAYYICDNNKNVIINNQYIYHSDEAQGGGYALHVYSANNEYTDTVICNNWIIKSNKLNLVAAYSNNMVLMNNIDFIGSNNLINNYIGLCKINNLKATSTSSNSFSVNANQLGEIILNNLHSFSRIAHAGKITFNNCYINMENITQQFCLYCGPLATQSNIFIKNCIFIANHSDGIISIRDNNTLNTYTIINCILINKKNNYIFYNSGAATNIYFYNNYSNCKNIARNIERESITADNNILNLNYNI